MTLFFEGSIGDFGNLFGSMLAPIGGGELSEAFKEACEELDGTVKMNFSNGRYVIDIHCEGETDE